VKRYLHKQGHLVWGQVSSSLVRDAKGLPLNFIAHVEDITRHKEAEDALEESEQKFQELFDEAPVGYYEFDCQGRITKVNRTELEMLGYRIDEMLGQPVWKFIGGEELSRQAALNKLAGLQPLARGLERTGRRKDGSTFPALIEDRLLRNPEGEIIGIRFILHDITERKRVEEEREKLIKDLQEALARVKLLSGMLPICSSCRKIRDDKGYWNQIEVYVRDHSEAEFTHGICPECFKKLYPDVSLEDL